jgi:type I restriction enzyme M protein
VSTVNQDTWDLSVKNPNGNDDVIHHSPAAIITEMEALDIENKAILQRIKGLL